MATRQAGKDERKLKVSAHMCLQCGFSINLKDLGLREGATGHSVLKATNDAVPVRLMKRALLFVTERLAAVLEERRFAVIFRLHGIGKVNGTGSAPAKLLASFLRKSDESTLGRVLVSITVL
jgi:hypothetical protein